MGSFLPSLGQKMLILSLLFSHFNLWSLGWGLGGDGMLSNVAYVIYVLRDLYKLLFYIIYTLTYIV